MVATRFTETYWWKIIICNWTYLSISICWFFMWVYKHIFYITPYSSGYTRLDSVPGTLQPTQLQAENFQKITLNLSILKDCSPIGTFGVTAALNLKATNLEKFWKDSCLEQALLLHKGNCLQQTSTGLYWLKRTCLPMLPSCDPIHQ